MGEKDNTVLIVVVVAAVLGILFMWWSSMKAKAAAAGNGGIGGLVKGAANTAQSVTSSVSNGASAVGGKLVSTGINVQEGIVNTFTLGGYNKLKSWL